ncbi:MAG: DUF134 domain-containing protein [Thermodesulfobacteriota bacterium]
MPRPRKCRWIQAQPRVRYYKPQGIPLRFLTEVVLPLEGLEALRLADLEGLDHETAGDLMKISRPTFTRVLAEARSILARALVNGWAIRIEGGNFMMADELGPPPPPDCRPGQGRCRRWRGEE